MTLGMETLSTMWQPLADGIDILMRPDDSNDIVALIAFTPLGSSQESRTDAGLVAMTNRMLSRGTKRFTSAQLAEQIDSLGISLAYSSTEDYSYPHVITTSDTLPQAVALLSEALFEPSFEPEEIEKERQTTLAAIRRGDDDLLSLTLKRFYQELYPNHGYGLPHSGLVESIGEITREQIVSCHEELVRGRYRIVAVGNFDPAALRELLQREFVARYPGGAADGSGQEPGAPIAAEAHRSALSRASEQSYLVAGFGALAPSDSRYMAARLLNSVLGEGMSSRLFQALREEKGLAYATGSSYHGLKLAGQLFGYIGTKPESLDLAREGMLAEFARIRTELVPEDELLRSKNYMIGKFLIDHQKNFRRAFYLGHFDQMGIGCEMDERYPEMISAVTAEQVRDVAAHLLTEPVIVELKPNS